MHNGNLAVVDKGPLK